ncbi:MAG TPA: formate dehydrogenase accessory protein FdhE [Acidisarcina sp.]|nr:formate dehydrogenase accessory protein FdhE [Acidisarcina sp.]
MKASLEDRIARATELIKSHPSASELLSFYRELALFQKSIYEELRSSDQTDMHALLRHFPALIELVRRAGPEPLASFGAEHLRSPEEQWELLLESWEGQATEGQSGEDQPRSDPENSGAGRFYARVLLQPYAENLAKRGTVDLQETTAICPFCSARPVAGVLRGEGDGAKRWLLCSLCATEWPFLRVACPNCGERDKDMLPIYTASEFEHVRVEACDRCKTYLKSIDLTRDGHAVPVVDELATVALNLWAEDHGYSKLESNLLGL